MADTGYRIVVGPDGQLSPPITPAALKDWIRRGTINAGTQIYDPDTNAWAPASALPILSGEFGGRPAYSSRAYLQQAEQPSRNAVIGVVVTAAVVLVVAIIFGVYYASLSGKTITVTSTDGNVSLIVPATWSRYDESNPEVASYRSMFRGRGFALMKTHDTQVNSGELDQITKDQDDYLTHRFNMWDGTPADVSSTTVSGYPARQFEFDEGGSPRNRRHFRDTLIDTPAGVYSIADFVGADEVSAAQPDLDTVIKSFRVFGSLYPAQPTGQ